MSDGGGNGKATIGCAAPSGFVLLTIAFFIMKAMGYIDWSWWLVFSPLWGPWALALGIAVVVGGLYLLVLGLATLYDKSGLAAWRRKRWREKLMKKRNMRSLS